MPDGLHSHDSKPLAFERFRTAKESIKVQLFVPLSDAGIARVIRNFLITRLNKHGHGELWFGIRNDGKAVGLEVNDIEALKMIEVSGSRKKVPKRKFLKESSGKTAERILALMAVNPGVTTEQIGEELGISGRAVRKQIATLRDAKQLLRTGGRKLGRWEVLK